MEIKPILIQEYQGMQMRMLKLLYDTLGISIDFWDKVLTDEEIEFRHRQFLIKYNLL